tara:strand:+ start:10 stop:1257 length:1248 start_codon:yes stop_codon:yes gene_type:complete
MGKLLGMIPYIEQNEYWRDNLIPELLDSRYKLIQRDNGVYIHWCEISKDPDSHDATQGNILPFIPTKVINDLRTDDACIVFSTWQESTNPVDNYPIEHCIDFDLVLEKFCDDNNIPCRNVVWVSGDLKVQERQKSKRIKAYGFTCYGHDILRHVETEINKTQWNLQPITERTFEKDFICLQRFMKPGRIYWSLLLYRNNFIHSQYVSIADRIADWSFFEKAKAFYLSAKKHYKHMSAYNLSCDQYFKDMWHDLADLGLSVPVTVDVHDHDKNWCAGWDTTLSSLEFYNKSFASVITETDMQSNGLYISEATFRPFIYQQPCVWAAQAGIVKQLNDWGFKTWSWLASEEYDNCPYMIDRLNMCKDSLIEMISTSRDKKVLERIHEQNIYNWNHLQNKFVDDQRTRFIKLLNDIVNK